ncbi:DNA adenine methylase [Runella sp. SP2]|uniref:DNA adenine methylase n=1 Tax=Runella sp. SP2 TaxID=2268026 RepID=UPI000F073FE2|nr:DNA adenine methylase [Runella sp. SP2]AYQ31365.1 DNA adenine methylase [Runella sp. SP2]
MKKLLKTPITYYGGKQMMLPAILPKIPAHTLYVEPFFGGGAVFFAKEPSEAEVVNDINHRLTTFYRALKYDFEDLQHKIDETFHSRAQHAEAWEQYDASKEDIQDALALAWSVWVQTNMSFGSMIGAGFGYDRAGKCALKLFNKKNGFTDAYKDRMKRVTIESYDVLKVIKAYDTPDTFFYLDPPYVSANQGHYAGYSDDDFRKLLDACASMKGKFLLSSYPESILADYIAQHGWNAEQHEKTLAVDGRREKTKKKIECLTWNYEVSK